ncbi:MAG: hypothetical protein JO101_11960 [Candidatus Eremiobacteraeota bacterium]|nr:hypothetical protein [Candidatus Eremiobacteraeota bacterium]
MIAVALLATLLVAQNTAGCAGADPAITSVKVAGMTPSGDTNIYHLSGTVTNLGSKKQASNVLQFVDVYLNGTKVDSRGVRPLAPGQSYTFGYDLKRASDAGMRTSHLRFQMNFRQPNPPGSEDCNPGNGVFRLNV